MLNFGSGRFVGRMSPRLCATLASLLLSQLPAAVRAEPEQGAPKAPGAEKNNKQRPQLAQAAPPPPAEPAAPPPSEPVPAPDVTPPAEPPVEPSAPADAARALEAEPGPAAASDGDVAVLEESAEDSTVAADTSQPTEGSLGDIVVTTNRRATNLQKYAGSASAFSQDELDRKGVKSVRDVGNVTPSVTVGTQEANVEVYIRGVGTDYNTELGDPTVAMHLDGVYIPRPRGIGSLLFDLERLEIGRGPQGTLRGRNAVAGTLNVIAAKPVLEEWVGEATLQLGNYSQRLARGIVNIPLGKHLALRIAGFGEVRDPFFKNAGPIQTIIPTESADSLAYRASLLFEPTRAVRLTVTQDFTQEGGTGYSGSNFNQALRAGILPNEVPDPRAVIFRGPQPSQFLQHWGVRGNLNIDLGPVQVEYLGSYRQLSYKQVSAGNAGVQFNGRPEPGADQLDNWGTSYWDTGSKSIVQELRLYAPDTSRLRWTAGGFYIYEWQKAFLGATADRNYGYLGQEYNMPSVKNYSFAGFADAIFDILKTWRATAGARISRDYKSRDGIGYQYGFDGTPGGSRLGTEGFAFKGFDRTDYQSNNDKSDFLNGIARFGARDTIGTALMDPASMIRANQAIEMHGTYGATFADFRVGTDYDLSKDNMVYGMFSTGHKSGGFNDNTIVDGVSLAPTYKPEVLYSTEIGSKNKFLNGNLAANVTAFWYAYSNQQFKSIRELQPSGVVGAAGASSAVIFNASSSRILGVEAEFAARLPAGMRADLAATFLDARFTSGEVADTRIGYDASSQPVVDLKSNLLPRAPQLSLNYGLSQNIQTGVGSFDWSIIGQTRSVQYMTVFNGDGRDNAGNVNPNLYDKVPSYTRFDINVGFTLPNKRIRIDAFVLNVTDVIYLTSFINTPDLNLRFFNPPRQFGTRLTVQL
jgi:iron complex outermembrane recepter protein